jgi:mannose-6-phosphate isomerase-like protein (cupin superfamily)
MSGHRIHRPAGEYQWQDVEVLRYKADGTAPFKDVTRQILFEGDQLGCQLRYFEVQAGGFSTLERHQHVHAVMILRGRGRCLVGAEIFEVGPHDLISVPPLTWHQFRAGAGEPLGFLCMVNAERDRPQLPSEAELRALRADPAVAAFLRDGSSC